MSKDSDRRHISLWSLGPEDTLASPRTRFSFFSGFCAILDGPVSPLASSDEPLGFRFQACVTAFGMFEKVHGCAEISNLQVVSLSEGNRWT